MILALSKVFTRLMHQSTVDRLDFIDVMLTYRLDYFDLTIEPLFNTIH